MCSVMSITWLLLATRVLIILSAALQTTKIIGNPLANRLEGREGDDKLWGKDGNDILIGGSGTDRLQGGEGADVFLFQAAGGNGLDTVVDFELGIDIIRIEPGESWTSGQTTYGT